jgi:hypothetical protein
MSPRSVPHVANGIFEQTNERTACADALSCGVSPTLLAPHGRPARVCVCGRAASAACFRMCAQTAAPEPVIRNTAELSRVAESADQFVRNVSPVDFAPRAIIISDSTSTAQRLWVYPASAGCGIFFSRKKYDAGALVSKCARRYYCPLAYVCHCCIDPRRVRALCVLVRPLIA